MMLSDLDRPIQILLAEDNPGDARLTLEALRATGTRFDLTVAEDGQEALELLFASVDDPAKRPDLILLDLNMPRVTGHEVLRQVKEHPTLRRIPAVILTTSSAREDMQQCYDLHANAYMTKPADISEFMESMDGFMHHWADIVEVAPA